MDYDKLKTKVAAMLAADPTLTDQQIADQLNAATVTETYSRFVTFRTLLSELPIQQAMSVIGKIKARAAAGDPVMAVILPSLQDTADGDGIDLSNANARLFVDSMVGEGQADLTAEEAAAVKGMAERKVPWPLSIGRSDGVLHWTHIKKARAEL